MKTIVPSTPAPSVAKSEPVVAKSPGLVKRLWDSLFGETPAKEEEDKPKSRSRNSRNNQNRSRGGQNNRSRSNNRGRSNNRNGDSRNDSNRNDKRQDGNKKNEVRELRLLDFGLSSSSFAGVFDWTVRKCHG